MTLTQEVKLFAETAGELDQIAERLEELTDWAAEIGARAIEDKLREAYGKVLNAASASRQYAVGMLVCRD